MRDAGIAAIASVAVAAAFPKFGAAWIVPFGMAALFWVWQGASWKRAAVVGWFAGMIFFAIDFAWVGHTVGSYVGAFGPFVMFGPALIEAPFWAACGIACALAYRYAPPAVAPLAAAAAFAAFEWLRSIGIFGAPFDQLGYTQADTPLRAIAAYAGTYGITFVLCVAGAYLADALHRRTWRPLAAAWCALIVFSGVAWLAWPARHLPPPTLPVAAIQGNIAQSLKWNNLDLAVYRYSMLTRRAAAADPPPKLIVWPETVIPIALNFDRYLTDDFAGLARDVDATIVAGSQRLDRRKFYNSLYVFEPNGATSLYDKRQLVPFAEWLPYKKALSWLPYVGALNGGITPGTGNGVVTTQWLKFAPLICWESAFADVAHEGLSRGAQALVVSTDDAWFGTTSGPYMHAQISQLRAVESGAYVIRAAATGISGIIRPDGTWQARSKMEEMTVISGKVGPRMPTLFSSIGPAPVGIAFVLIYLVVVLSGALRRRAGCASADGAHGWAGVGRAQGDTG